MTTLDALYQHLAIILEIHPEILFIELGSNDLCYRNSDPQDIADNILRLANAAHNMEVKEVYVSQVLYRRGCGIPTSVWNYNAKVDALNRHLEENISNASHSFHFWKHRGLRFPAKPVLARDGVHFNKQGSNRYYRSVRGAVLNAMAKLQVPIRGYLPGCRFQ